MEQQKAGTDSAGELPMKITIPTRWSAAVEAPQDTNTYPTNAAREPGSWHPVPQRILFVDDDKFSREFVEIVLARLGLEVDLASNGAEALDLLSKSDYDLVLMDCYMPVMGGFEATRRIRDGSASCRNPNIPILAITADVMQENIAACRLVGMNDCLTKPASMAALRKYILKWLPLAGETSEAYTAISGCRRNQSSS